MKLSIDAEFQSLLPMASADELKQLEQNILTDGLREPLVVTSRGTVIDGMTRFVICERHNIGVRTVIRDFASRDEAKAWIIDNQAGRRNLEPGQRAMLAALRATFTHGGARRGFKSPMGDLKTQSESAQEFNVSKKQVERAALVVSKGTPELQKQVLDGAVSPRAAAEVSTLTKDKQRAVVVKGPAAVKAAAAKIRSKKPVAENSPFPDSSGIDEALSALARLKGCLVALVGDVGADKTVDPAAFYMSDHRQEWSKQIDAIRFTLKNSRPYSVCPYCEGKGQKCSGCQGVGWVGKEIFMAAPKDYQARVKESIHE